MDLTFDDHLERGRFYAVYEPEREMFMSIGSAQSIATINELQMFHNHFDWREWPNGIMADIFPTFISRLHRNGIWDVDLVWLVDSYAVSTDQGLDVEVDFNDPIPVSIDHFVRSLTR